MCVCKVGFYLLFSGCFSVVLSTASNDDAFIDNETKTIKCLISNYQTGFNIKYYYEPMRAVWMA